MNQKILITIGSMAALGASYSIYANVRQNRKDELAAGLIHEIQKVIDPSGSGLVSENAFDLHYKDRVLEKVKGRIILLNKESAKELATQLTGAFRGWWLGGDKEDVIYGVFRKLKDKVQVSQVANAFYNNNKVNLIDKLTDKLDQSELKMVLGIVKRLPAYRKSS